MRHALRPTLAALAITALLLAGAAPVTASPQKLTLHEARQYALQLLRQDQPAAAREIARGLLRANRKDPAALLLMARAENDLGNHATAEQAAKAAFLRAKSDTDRFAAAYIVSQTLTAQKKYGAAQWWLRRAGTASDDPRLENAARNQFRRVKAENPWTARLRFSLSPSNNVNNGSETAGILIGGVIFSNPAALPLSGWVLDSQASLRHRFETSGKTQVYAGMGLRDRRVFLSSASKNSATPALRNDDFSHFTYELTLGTVTPSASGKSATGVELSLGESRDGGVHFLSYGAVSLTHSRRLANGHRLQATLSFERQERFDSRPFSASVLALQTSYAMATGNGGRIKFGLKLSDTDAQSALIEHRAATLSLSYTHGRKILGALPTIDLGLTAREFDRAISVFTPGTPTRRSDRKVTLGVNMVFPDLEYLGFAPTLGLSASRNRSSIANYNTQAYGVSLGFRSTF